MRGETRLPGRPPSWEKGDLMGRIVRVCVVAAMLSASVAGAGGDSPLTKAVKAGDLQAVRALVKKGADVNAKFRRRFHAAPLGRRRLRHRDRARADRRESQGRHVANDFGVTPLLHASRTGDAAMVDILLEAGADPRSRIRTAKRR